MTRIPIVLLLAAATALAQPGSVAFLDGTSWEDAELVSADAKEAVLRRGGRDFTVPLTSLMSVHERRVKRDWVRGHNLFLRSGDSLKGTVTGTGDAVTLKSPVIQGLKVSLKDVAAVRFGVLQGRNQAAYEEAFERMRKEGVGAILVYREAQPFRIKARVEGVRGRILTVRAAGVKKELDAEKVFGFVMGPDEDEPAEADGVRVRVVLVKGGSVILPLTSIDKDTLRGGGATLQRAHVGRIEFLGSHFRHLSEMEPIQVKEVAALGKAPRWKPDAMVHGGPLRMDGRTYARGIGVHASSRLEFVLGSRWKAFYVLCGIDDAAGPMGEAVFRIYADGELKAERRMRRGDPPARLLLDVEGADRLVLEVKSGGSYMSDLCDWARARLFRDRPPKLPADPGSRTKKSANADGE